MSSAPSLAPEELRQRREYLYAAAGRRAGRPAADTLATMERGIPGESQPMDSAVSSAAVELAYSETHDWGPGCDIYTLADLEKYSTPPDHVLAGTGLLKRGAGCLCTGSTGIGKSVLAEQISVSVAGGVSILGCIPVKAAFRVLHIQAENDAETLKRDFLSLVKHSGAGRDAVEQNLSVVHAYALSGRRFTEWLPIAVAGSEPDLIVVDPYQAFAGAVDINGTSGFLEWISPVQKLILEANAALLLVTHTPKPGQREHWNVRDMVYLAAGTSALANWARTSMELVTVGQETSRFRLSFGKSAERTGLVTEDGRICRSLYLEHSGNIHEPFWRMADNQGEPSRGKYDAAIREALQAEPDAGDMKIAGQVGCDRTTVHRARRRMNL